jgi:hypothetical protein
MATPCPHKGRSTSLKPSGTSGNHAKLVDRAMAWAREKTAEEKLVIDSGGSDQPNQKVMGSVSAVKSISADPKEWAAKVYRGNQPTGENTQIDDGALEFDLDEEEAEQASKYLAIAVFYSRKCYNPQYLFSDMLAVWGFQGLSSVEKIGDYKFRLEFGNEEKRQVIDGGPGDIK